MHAAKTMPDKEAVMGAERKCLRMDNFDQGLMVKSLVGFRNDLIRDKMPTEDVDRLLLRVIDAPQEKKKRRLFDRDAR